MPPPKRRADPRTREAIVEDLMVARFVGGLDRADEQDLAATIDWLRLAGIPEGEAPLSRARELLRHYVKRQCDTVSEGDAEATERVAASSLGTLLLRPGSERDMAQKVRRQALEASGHTVSADAVRHREDAIIGQIADEVTADLEKRRLDVPQSVEAALHEMMRLIIERRSYFHNWLCALYPPAPPLDEDEEAKRALFFDTGFIWFCRLLRATDYAFNLSRRLPDVTLHEATLAHLARHIRYNTFPGPDREVLLPIVRGTDLDDETLLETVQGTDAGRGVFDRWVAWVQTCAPTCAFERTFDWSYMCRPHVMLTHMYNIEVIFQEAGFRLEPSPEVMPRHVSIRPDM